jgi:hypothetical protein
VNTGSEQHRIVGESELMHAQTVPGRSKASVAAEALAVALALDNEWWQGRVLGRLVRLLSGDQVAQAVGAGRGMRSASARATCLVYLAQNTAPDIQAALAEEALAALSAAVDDQQRLRLVCQVAPCLAPGRREAVAHTALLGLAAMPDDRERAMWLWGLASTMSEASRLEAVSQARAMAEPGPRAVALAALVVHIAQPVKDDILAEAVVLARNVTDPEERAFTLAVLVRPVSDDARPVIAQEALDSAEAADDSVLWARTLDWIGAHLNSASLDAATIRVESLRASEARTVAFAALGACQPPDRRDPFVLQALTCASGLDDWYRCDLLRRLADCLSATTLAPALELARGITDPWPRADALARLAVQLPYDQRKTTLAESLEAARACTNGWMRAQALATVCEQWPP